MAPIIHTVNLCKVYAVGKERDVAQNDVSISIEKDFTCSNLFVLILLCLKQKEFN